MPAESDHPVFEAPADPNVKIWRYMDFTKFISIVDSNSLFFSRADMLGDPFEGSMSFLNKEKWPSMYSSEVLKALNSSTSHNIWMRQWTFVNCWHMNEVESVAMWQLYAKSSEAVAIQSTYQDLHRLLPNDTYIGVVKYIDYKTQWMPEGNAFYPYVHKRRSFEHERELRAIRVVHHTKDFDGDSGFDYTKTNSESGELVPLDLHYLQN